MSNSVKIGNLSVLCGNVYISKPVYKNVTFKYKHELKLGNNAGC